MLTRKENKCTDMYTEQRSLEIISEEYIIVPSVNEGKTIKIGEGQGIGLFCLFGM